MRLTLIIVLTFFLFTKASGQVLEKFEFSDCLKECIGDSTKIDRIVQTNDLTEISLTAYANCIGNLQGQIKLTNDTLDLKYSVKTKRIVNEKTGEVEEFADIVFCDCIFKLTYAVRGLKTLDLKRIKINGETLSKINRRHFPKIDTSEYVFTTIENPAEFPGGKTRLMEYVNKNLRHPKNTASSKISEKYMFHL